MRTTPLEHGLLVPTLLALPLVLLAACRTGSGARSGAAGARDPHSHARPDEVRTTHLALELELDFWSRSAEGSATFELERRDPRAPLVLDTQGLEILGAEGEDGSPRRFELGPEHPVLGRALSVQLERRERRVRVRYRTTEGAEAMQWLGPAQTAGGRQPFLFTQGQSILTRTWIPLQDSPGVRITYEARVRAPAGLTVVMSAEQLGQDADGAFCFRMPQPIPPYLVALACGELEFRPISASCGIWAEPSVVESARREFEDTPAMIAAAERLFGPYRWERYDMLVLPPSFPFGGMENPRLTFLTPTVIAGDRSLVALIAHELAHSWSGNLVTNATWSDFWLNEGFTVYLEGRIMEAVYGRERAELELAVEVAGLERELEELDPRDQVLQVDLADRHPDEYFSGVPYTKGALFLMRLEELAGRARFDTWLNGYFGRHSFRSITTDEFVADLRARLLDPDPTLAARVDLATWLREPGLPADTPRPRASLLETVERELTAWRGGRAAERLDTAGWSTHQWLHFLDGLRGELDPERMAELDQAFGLTSSGNSEILCRWLELAIQNGYAAADPRLEEFLLQVGRRKFLKPLYSELAKTPEGLERARAIYARARPRYHAVSTGTLDQVLAWS